MAWIFGVKKISFKMLAYRTCNAYGERIIGLGP
jgi:hypothetical protein